MVTKSSFAFKIVIIALLLFFAGCATVKISEIKDDPQKFKDVTVNVNGKVENSIKLADYNIIKLIDDDENSVIVIKYNTLPEIGKKAVLEGKVKVYHIPLIDKNIYYIMGETAGKNLKKLQDEKSTEFKQFMQELIKNIKEISNDENN